MNNIAQSNPDGELERLSGVRKLREPEDEGLQKKALDEPVGASEGKVETSSKPKKSKSGLIVVLILVVLAIAGGGVAWWLNETTDEGSDEGEVVLEDEKDDGEDEIGEDEDALLALDLEDELVQKVYGELMGGIDSVLRDSFYINKRVMDGKLTEEDVKVLAENSAKPDEMMKMFGREVEADSLEKEGTDASGVVVHYLDKAEKQGDELYFYEIALANGGSGLARLDFAQVAVPVYLSGVVGSEMIDRRLNDDIVYEIDPAEYDVEAESERPSWTKIDREKLNYYKWTFRKQANGDYVYQGVEKLR